LFEQSGRPIEPITIGAQGRRRDRAVFVRLRRLADDVLLGEPLPLAIAQQVIEQRRFSGTQKAESTVTGKRSGA
jgi:hypothetical protein